MQKKQCNTCRFWKRNDKDIRGRGGECRRARPDPMVLTEKKVPGGVNYVDHVGAWPLTFANDWCGEWESTNRPQRVFHF